MVILYLEKVASKQEKKSDILDVILMSEDAFLRRFNCSLM